MCMFNTTLEHSSLVCTETYDDVFGDQSTAPPSLSNEQSIALPSLSDEQSIALPPLSDEAFKEMIAEGDDHLPEGDYLERLKNGDLDMNVRIDCLEWIWKAHSYYGFRNDSFALAVNYYDRFMSVFEPPKDAPWINQLLSIVCLSLAAKMEGFQVPGVANLQFEEPRARFESITIQRMEFHVFRTLGWKLRAYTPYTFIDYFLIKITNDQLPLKSLITKAFQIISSTTTGIDFLEFRPCEIAAAVALTVVGSIEAVDTNEALPCFNQFEKDRVFQCVEMIHNLKLVSPPPTPNGVLEAACGSSKTDGGESMQEP